MGFVDDDQQGTPEFFRQCHQLGQEIANEGAAFGVRESIQVDDGGRTEVHELPAQQPRGVRRGRHVAFRAGQDIVVLLAQGTELPFLVQHNLLHPPVRLFEQSTDGPALARTAGPLDEQAGRDEVV